MPAFIRLSCVLCAALCLTACAPLLSLVGSNHTLVQVVAQVERVKLAGDGASYVGSGKTITDHALSMVTGEDCKVLNVVTREPVCVTRTANAAADEKVRLSLGPATEPLPRPEARTPPEIDTESTAPPPELQAGDE